MEALLQETHMTESTEEGSQEPCPGQADLEIKALKLREKRVRDSSLKFKVHHAIKSRQLHDTMLFGFQKQATSTMWNARSTCKQFAQYLVYSHCIKNKSHHPLLEEPTDVCATNKLCIGQFTGIAVSHKSSGKNNYCTTRSRNSRGALKVLVLHRLESLCCSIGWLVPPRRTTRPQ